MVVAMPTMMAALKLRDIRIDMMARQPKPIHTGPLRAHQQGVRPFPSRFWNCMPLICP